MTPAAPLPTNLGPGLRRIVELALWFAAGQVRRMLHALGGNAPVDLTMARRLVRRLRLIVRFAVIIFAIGIEPPPARTRAPTPQRPRGAGARGPVFALGRGWRRGWRDVDAPQQSQPEAFAKSRRDAVNAIKQQFEALSGALSNLAPLARRFAGRLRRAIIVPGWRPPKRQPPPAEREGYEELAALHAETVFHLREARRRWACA